MKAWFVWNEDAGEGVVLCEEKDAIYAATGRRIEMAISCLADEWRELYACEDRKIEYPRVVGNVVDGIFIKD